MAVLHWPILLMAKEPKVLLTMLLVQIYALLFRIWILIWFDRPISSCSQFFLSASRVWMSIWSHQSSYSEGKGEFDFYTLPKRNYETDMTMSNWFFVCLCCIQLKVSILLFSAYTHWVLGEYWYLHFDSRCSK